MNKIFPLPKYSFADSEKDSRLCIYFRNSKPYPKNSGFRPIYLYIDIICHLDVWMINSALRPYSITHEVDKLFNNQDISELSIKKIFFEDWFLKEYANYYYGYCCVYELSDNSNIGCG